MADPQRNVDSNGVIDDETSDPGENINAPDPLLGETARSGALSTPSPAVGSLADQKNRVASGRSAMTNLQGQYSNLQEGLTGAYKSQQQALIDARDRLLNNNPYMPSDKELALQQAAAWGGARDAAGRFDPSAISASKATGMAEQREAEAKKQELLAQYATQIPQAQIGQYNAMMNSNIQRQRIQQSADTSAENKTATIAAQHNAIGTTGMVWNPATSSYEFHPEIAQAQEQQKAQNAKDAAAAKISAARLSAGQMSAQDLDFAATWLHDKGSMPPGYQSRMSNGMVNPATTAIYKAMEEKYAGESATAIIANQGQVAASQKVLQDFQSGATSKDLNKLNTAVQHINVLKPAIAQLDNTQIPFVNAIKNTWNQQVLGSPAPTDFNGVRDFVVGEISKAVLPNGGGEAERMALAKSASQANSGAALNSIVDKWQQLLAGKTNATKMQWDNGTMGRFGDFDTKFLMPDTKVALGRQPAAAPAHPGQTPQPAPQQQAPVKPRVYNPQTGTFN